MTKSTITRERIQRIIRAINSEAYDEEEIREWLSSDEIMELSRMALAAMDSEPLAVTDGELNTALQLHRLTVYGHSQLSDAFRAGFRYARRTTPQPAPVVSAELLHTAASAIEDLLTTKDRTGAGVWFDLPFRLRSAANAQPAPVVPEEMTPEMMRSVQLNSELGAYAASNLSGAYDLFAEFWKEACRAAMLSGGKS
ncbi:hypothetical protein [Klebsiella variicola]|uniref:hypothetical protein n=1 Tax=Klebsiella variicola TaxID=244366 RepID=UPI0035A2B434